MNLLSRYLKWLISRPNYPRVSAIDYVSSFLSRLCMPLLIVAVLITFYEVITRYLFASPTLWVNEMTLWIGSAVFLVAGVYAMQQRSHIRITAVYDIVPRQVRIVFDIIACAVVIGYAALLIIPSFHIAWGTLMSWERFGTFWNPPIPATVKPLVLICTFLVALQAISNLITDTFIPLSEEAAPDKKNQKQHGQPQ